MKRKAKAKASVPKRTVIDLTVSKKKQLKKEAKRRVKNVQIDKNKVIQGDDIELGRLIDAVNDMLRVIGDDDETK